MGGTLTPDPPPRARSLDDGVLVRMPLPRERAEAQYVIAIAAPSGLRYFTLEKAGPPTQEPYMLCEWAQTRHCNLGPFIDGTEDGVLANIRARLR